MQPTGTFFPTGKAGAISNLDPINPGTTKEVFSYLTSIIRAEAEWRKYNLAYQAAAPTSPTDYMVWLTPNVLSGNSLADGDLKIYDPDASSGTGAFVDPTEALWKRVMGANELLWSEIKNKPASYPPSTHTHSEYAGVNHAHNGYAPTSHTHSEYAGVNHAHNGYAPTSHTHSEYAGVNHAHSGYAPTSHTHSEYAGVNHTHNGYAPTSHTHSEYDTHAALLYHPGQPNNGYLYYSNSDYSSSDDQNQFFEYRSNGIYVKKAGFYLPTIFTAARKLTAAGVAAGMVYFRLYNMSNGQELGVLNIHNMDWWREVGKCWDRSPIPKLIYLPAGAIVGMQVSGNDATVQTMSSRITLLKLGAST